MAMTYLRGTSRGFNGALAPVRLHWEARWLWFASDGEDSGSLERGLGVGFGDI